ncbi:MAG TPA: Fur family transcriptional regulator [Clostridiales bacterium]|nr:Fur family transcriptional regulator [Clostridiales bacterium]
MKKITGLFEQKLRLKGYRVTGQRQAVLDVIVNNEGRHLCSEEIYELVKADFPEIGLATVYRTLFLLENMGIIYKIDLDDGKGRYELNKGGEDHLHHHLICTECGSISEVNYDLLEFLEEQIYNKNDFLVKNHSVKFYGICGKCLKTLP